MCRLTLTVVVSRVSGQVDCGYFAPCGYTACSGGIHRHRIAQESEKL